jgi:F-type H+-transporting ATPase subunit b
MGIILSGGSPIDLDGSFFFQLAIFFSAFFILKSLVFRPVMALFDAREQAIVGSKRESETMTRDADGKRTHLEGELNRVRQAANAQRDKLRTETQELARKVSESARIETAAALADARARLDREAQEARQRAGAQVPDLARRIADRLLARSAP